MIYGYERVSTRSQTRDGNSLETQQKTLNKHEALEENIYWDIITGDNITRPNFDRLFQILQAGDTLVVTKLDRIATSIPQASDLITVLVNRGIKVDIVNIGIIDNTSTGITIRNILLAIAQFEKDMIVERKMVAKIKNGFKEGRPKEYTQEQLDHAMNLLEKHSYKQVEKTTKISISTLQREKRKQQQLGRDMIVDRKMVSNTKNGFKEVRPKEYTQAQLDKKMNHLEKHSNKEGRPKKYTQAELDLAMNLLEKHSYKKVEKVMKISISTLQREKKKKQLL